MNPYQHHVLDDVIAERTRGSILFKMRTRESLRSYVAILLIFVTAALSLTSGALSEHAIPLAILIAGAVGYLVGCLLYIVDDLEPLTSSYSFEQLNKLAGEHPEVAEFVSEAIGKGWTFRTRDMWAARTIEGAAKAIEAIEYDVLEKAHAASALDVLIKNYCPGAANKSGDSNP
jgi:hypothetical protein